MAAESPTTTQTDLRDTDLRDTDLRDTVVLLDGSDRDHRALEIGAALTKRLASSLHAVTVRTESEPERALVAAEHAAGAGAAFREVHASGFAAGVVDALEGRVAVMATRANPFLYDSYVGSAAEAVVAEARAPVVLVGPEVVLDDPWNIERIICPVSAELASLVAVPAAAHWAREFAVPLNCVHVDTSGDVVAHAPSFWPPELFGEETGVVAAADPVAGIVDEAGTNSLVVMATSSPQGLRRIAAGSVMTNIVAAATRPVVVIGPHVHLATLPF